MDQNEIASFEKTIEEDNKTILEAKLKHTQLEKRWTFDSNPELTIRGSYDHEERYSSQEKPIRRDHKIE